MTSAEKSSAAKLQLEFDRTFALPEPPTPEALERYLAITLGNSSYAVRLRDVAGLAACRNVVALPGTNRELLGLVGHRSALVPVFDLGALLGHPPCESPRWLILAATTDMVAFAVTEISGQVEGSAADLRAPEPGMMRPHVEAVLDVLPRRTVIGIASVLDTITKGVP